jgi:thioredoxin 1
MVSRRWGFLAGLVLAVALGGCGKEEPPAAAPPAQVQPPSTEEGRPRLLDLGSKNCIPCKKMAPLLEELRKEYEGKFRVDFVDVWLPENEAEARRHNIQLIPTQIFFDAQGRELFRHEGFYSKEEILSKWKELGFDFRPGNR